MANSQTITINVKAIADMSDVLSNTKQIQNALGQLKLPGNLQASFTKSFGEIEKEVAKVQTILNKPTKSKSDVTGLEKGFDKINTLLLQVQTNMGKIDPKILEESFTLDTSKLDEYKNKIDAIKQTLSQKVDANSITQITNAMEQLTATGSKSKAGFAFLDALKSGDFKEAQGILTGLEGTIARLQTKLANDQANNKDVTNLQTRINAYEELQKVMQNTLGNLGKDAEVPKLTADLSQLEDGLKNLSISELQNFEELWAKITGQDMSNIISGTREFGTETKEATQATVQFNSELSQVKSRVQYFLGLNNAVNLFRRAIRSAFETVKELDKVMTETAVVTDFTVGDMWNQLPHYTQVANELGVTTKGAYETMTLFYQQGLDTNEAFALGTETMKMARIAGMEYTEATDAMTAALRGFNMELNETSAQRVNDVYSQLAAKTASNVEEISTAMTKAASIAHNAGMEFETTSAFLSQIIETTREAPETAGTALKTVIARFTELKKAPSEIGEVEGEMVDANKIETALKSVGVALRDTKGEFRDLDDVFLDLNAKWDSLTKNEQRYVATMAAGSRQQSRFIAMMSDYERTQELVGEAYDAAGASQRQYEKTLDSLESKLNKLKNAWNEFLMGITDSNLIKGFVDMLTKLLNGLNKFSDFFGKGSGFVKTLMTLMAWGGLRKVLGQSNNGFLAFLFGKKDTTKTFAKSLTNIVEKVRKLRLSATGLGLASAQAGTAAVAGEAAASAGLTTIIGQLATILGQLTPIIAIAGALVLIGVAVGQAWKKISLKGQIIQAQELQDSYKNLASSAQDTKDSLQGVSDTYQELTEAINNAITVEEKAAAIRDRNDFISKSIQENNEYTKFLESSIDINGQLILTLDEEALAEAIENAEKNVSRATAGISFAAATEAGLRAQQAQKQAGEATFYRDSQDQLRGIWTYTNSGGEVTQLREMTQAEIAAYTNYMTTAEQATAEMIQQATNGYLQMLEGKDVEGSVAEGIAKVFAQSFDSKEYFQATSSWGVTNWDEYANLIESNLGQKVSFSYQEGYSFTKDQLRWLYKYYTGEDASSAPAIDWGNKWASKLWDAINLGSYNQKEEGRIDQLIELIKSDESRYSPYLSAYSGDFGNQNVLGKTLEDLLPEYNAETFSELSKVIGIPAEEIDKQIRLQLEQQQEARRQRLIETGAGFSQKGFTRAGFNFEDFITLNNTQYQDYIADILSNIEDANFGAVIGNSLLAGMDSEDWEGSDLQEWISSIDFSNPIAAAAALRDGTASLNQEIRDTASAWELAAETSDAFSAESQVQYLLTSESFNSLNEQLDDFIEENGKISADNVEELAGSCAELEQLLENNVISASGLAKALTDLQSGTTSILDLDNALLSAYNSMGTLNEVSSSTLAGINGFDPGQDENDVTRFIGTANDFISEQIEKGAYGNSQMRQYMDFIFGGGAGDISGLSGDAYIAQLKANQKWLEENTDNMYSAWHDAIAAGNDGIAAAADGSYDAISVYEKNGEIILDIGTNTAEQLEQALIAWGESVGLSAEQIRMMLTDYKNSSGDLQQEISENEIPSAIDNWISELGQTAEGSRVYTENQLDALAKSVGKSKEEVQALIDEWVADGQNDEVKLIDVDTGNLDSAYAVSKLFTELGTTTRNFVDETNSELTTINFDSVKQTLEDAGLEEALDGVLNQMAADFVEAGEVFQITVNGENIVVETEGFESATDAIQAALQENSETEAEQAINVAINVDDTQVTTTTETIDNFNTTLDSAQTNATDGINLTVTGQTSVINLTNRVTNLGAAIDSVNKKTLSVQQAATGGKVPAHAKGTTRLKPGIAFTGEEGPEIVWNKEQGYAYITGESHPEFQKLQPGDQIFNAQETKKILGSAAKGGKVPAYASAYGAAIKYNQTTNKKSTVSGTKASKSSSTSSDSKVEADAEFWENELDWLFNLLEDIAALEQEANQLQALQDAYMSDDSKTGKDLYELLVKQLGNLNAQLLGNQELLTRREDEMREFMAQTNRFPDLVRYNETDRTLEIDWDTIDQLDKTSYDMVTEFISKAEDIQSNIRDAENAVLDVEKELREFENVWRDEYIDFEETVGQALINSQQKVIDNYSELNDTLSDNNSQILDSLSESISLSRQIRDNTKTEEEIADMEARLAYLRRDTTGGNQAEIQKLEKELEDARQSYENTLIDQALDRLKDENDAAAEQRQQEIDLMQAQLDYAEQSGEFNKEIHDLIKGARDDENGGFRVDSELMELLKKDSNFSAKTAEAQNQWMSELLTTFKTVSGYMETLSPQFANDVANALRANIEQYKALPNEDGSDQKETSAEGDIGSRSQGQYHIDVNKDFAGWFQNEENGDWYYTKEGGNIQTGWKRYKNQWYYLNPENGGRMAANEAVQVGNDWYNFNSSGVLQTGWSKNEATGKWYYTDSEGYAKNGWVKGKDGYWYYVDHGEMQTGWIQTPSGTFYLNPDGGAMYDNTTATIDGIQYTFDKGGYLNWNTLDEEQKKKLQKQLKQVGFLTGGLTSKTGLAMLHGTPSAPEYVLNAAQTQAFLKLADVLPSVLNQNTGAAGVLGGINLNLVMNVDEIGSDYDVDRIANRVKEIIYNAGSYRNVNTLNFLR